MEDFPLSNSKVNLYASIKFETDCRDCSLDGYLCLEDVYEDLMQVLTYYISKEIYKREDFPLSERTVNLYTLIKHEIECRNGSLEAYLCLEEVFDDLMWVLTNYSSKY